MVTGADNRPAPPRDPPRLRRRDRRPRRWWPLALAGGLAAIVLGVTAAILNPFDLSRLSFPGSADQWAPVPDDSATTMPPTADSTFSSPAPTSSGVPSRPGGASPAASAPAPASTPRPTPFAGRLRSTAGWMAIFDNQWPGDRAEAEAWSRSTDSWDHYGLSYSIDALTAAYLATGREASIDEGLGLLENVVASAKPSSQLPTSTYKDGYLGWVSAQENGNEVPLYESYLWRYGTGLLRVIHDDPQLWQDTALRARYTAVLAFVERNVFEKWQARGADENIFRSRAHMASHWALIALQLSRITTDETRRRTYLDTVRAIDTDLPNAPSSLRGQLRMNPRYPGAYVWSDEWGRTGGRAQDVSHGNAVIAYVVEANAAGMDWTDRDLQRFVNTFTEAIWPATPRPGQPEGADAVDGNGEGNGWFSDGFVKLGRFDPVLQQRLERHDVGRSVQFLANNALNVALLACHGIAPSAAPSTTPACRLE